MPIYFIIKADMSRVGRGGRDKEAEHEKNRGDYNLNISVCVTSVTECHIKSILTI